MKGLVWFRSDLRTDDNPALKSAFEQCDEVIAIYLYSPTQAALHNESNVKNDFIIKNLKSLGSKLKSLNVPLVIKNSEGFNQDPSLINSFANEHGINKVYLNKQFGIDENERDKNFISLLTASNIDFEKFNDQIIYEAGFLKTGQGNPFSVFTPFKRRWVENFDMNFLDIDYQYTNQRTKETVSLWQAHYPELALYTYDLNQAALRSLWLKSFIGQDAGGAPSGDTDYDIEIPFAFPSWLKDFGLNKPKLEIDGDLTIQIAGSRTKKSNDENPIFHRN